MHILAAIERIKMPKSLAKIVVTSNAGIANANMLATAISEHFNAEITDVLSIHSLYQKLDDVDCDFIVSTTPIDSPIPCIVVNAVLDEENYQMISNAIAQVRKKNSTSNSTYEVANKDVHSSIFVSDFLKEENIVLNKYAGDWKEALISAGELLLWSNNITVNYLNQMVSLVLKYGPYIVFADGIALAHASPNDGVLSTGFSFVRLDHPVSFGHDKKDVNIIIGCAINDTPAETMMLTNFMNIINIPEFNQKLLLASDKKEIIDIIRHYEQRHVAIKNKSFE